MGDSPLIMIRTAGQAQVESAGFLQRVALFSEWRRAQQAVPNLLARCSYWLCALLAAD
jgi:hypothetical protein